MIGRRLGHFRISAKLGEGGMGEVYRAEDEKLGREVAIKVLPRTVTADPERLARFEREARLLAALNHPRIAGVYETGVETGVATDDEAADGTGSDVQFLVLELAEGETLEERLARGPLPVGEALAIALAVAEALEAAHERGVIHRDLKPSNVKVAGDGSLKVLDFGLAKAFDSDGSGDLVPAGALVTQSPTLTAQMTQAGVILGTAAYMSPEQARGQEVDRRADIWAFGVLVMELLTRQRVFAGETLTDTLASVIRAEPSWDDLPPETPLSVRRLLERCLEKDPARRLRDIGEARFVLQDPGDVTISTLQVEQRSPVARMMVIGAVCAVLGVLVAGSAFHLGWVPMAEDRPETIQLAADLGDLDMIGGSLAVSPDGTEFYFRGLDGELMRRRLGDAEPQTLGRIGWGRRIAVSPDGQWLAFYDRSAGLVRRIASRGGPMTTICPLPKPIPFGLAWSDHETVVFSAGHLDTAAELYRVNSAGGDATPVEAEELRGLDVAWPGRHPRDGTILISVFERSRTEFLLPRLARTGTLDLETGHFEPLVEQAVFGRWSDDHLLTVDAEGNLIATSPRESPPRSYPVLSGVGLIADRYPDFDAADSGTLVYQAGMIRTARLVWAEAGSQPETLVDLEGWSYNLKISPDTETIALNLQVTPRDIWVFHRQRETLSRQVFSAPTRNYNPTWHPDGDRVAFGRLSAETESEYSIDVAYLGSSEASETLFTSQALTRPTSWSRDGTILIASVRTADGTDDIWAIPVDGESAPWPVVKSPYDDDWAQLSPDGRWLVYEGDASGRDEIYLRPFPDPGPEAQVSRDGGTDPRWSDDGLSIFYVRQGDVYSVAFEPASPPKLGLPQVQFGGLEVTGRYDLADNGRYLAYINDDLQEERISVVLGWTGLLRETGDGSR